MNTKIMSDLLTVCGKKQNNIKDKTFSLQLYFERILV